MWIALAVGVALIAITWLAVAEASRRGRSSERADASAEAVEAQKRAAEIRHRPRARGRDLVRELQLRLRHPNRDRR